MRRKYDQDKMFAMVSESYELGLSPVDYCRRPNFPTKIFYRYRQQYIKIYGTSPMPSTSDSGTFVSVNVATPATRLSIEIGSALRLRFDSLPDARYLSELLTSLPDASFK